MRPGLLIGGLGPTELLLIGGIIVLLFGASKIPELARSLGRAKSEYEKGTKEGEEEIEDLEDEDEDKPTSTSS